LPWTTRLRTGRGGTLAQARFSRWVKLRPAGENNAGGNEQHAAPAKDSSDAAGNNGATTGANTGLVRTIASLNTGDPLLLARRYDRGDVVLLASTLDADWNTLPAKPDYVALLHEIVFQLATGAVARNVDVGVPLVVPVAADVDLERLVFRGPGDTVFPAQPGGNELHPRARLNDTRLPGVYTLDRKAGAGNDPVGIEHFVVNDDRDESDLTPLSDRDRAGFEQKGRLSFIDTDDELRQEIFAADSQTELWSALFFVFLAILIGEVIMTRRLVRGGHAMAETEEARQRT